MPYNVYLMNGLGISAKMNRTDLTATQSGSIISTVKGYFDRVVTAHDAGSAKTKYGSASVSWVAGAANPQPNELLIYLLPSGATVVTAGKLAQGNPPAGEDGLTNLNVGGATGAEVYLQIADMQVIANLMFHEAMHNKLHLGNGMHSQGGLASAVVDASTQLTAANINAMAAALDTPRPQWTGGITLLAQAAAVDDNDPSKGLF